MVHSNAFTAVAAAVLLALPAANAAGLYHKKSPVIQVDGKNYDRLIANSNHTSIVEFYAPWCGHCKNLQPEFEKAARSLQGLAKVAAVNCDEDENKSFCGQFGIKGFPTLKIVKPGKKAGRPIVEDYNGARDSKAITETVLAKIPNHVKKVTDKELDEFLTTNNESSKAILFTEKGTTSALLKAVAIDFLGSVQVAQVRSKEKECVERFGLSGYPTIVLLPGGDAPGIVYAGEMKKAGIVDFLTKNVGPSNPDPAPAKVKMPKKKDTKNTKADKKAQEDFESASSSHAKSEATEAVPTAAEETLESDANPTESPDPIVTPTAAPIDLEKITPPISSLLSAEDLVRQCLSPKSGTCILAFTPEASTSNSDSALSSLAEVAHKYTTSKRAIFPFYSIPTSNEAAQTMKSALDLNSEVEVVAVNSKRGWWRRFDGSEYTIHSMESWIDAIRMGEGEKRKLPGTILAEKTFESDQKPLEDVPVEAETTAQKIAEPETASEPEPVAEPETTVSQQAEEITPEPEAAATPEATTEPDAHDEL